MLPYLVFLPTLSSVPHFIFVFAIAAAVLRRPTIDKKDLVNSVFFLIIVIVSLSTLNFFAHWKLAIENRDFVPYPLLMLGTYIIAARLTDNDIKTIIILVVIEASVGLIEFALGIKTFFPDSGTVNTIKDSSLLYFRSVYGVSNNSSSFAVKVLLGYLLIYYLRWSGFQGNLFKVVLIAGLVASFNRTAMIVVVVFHLMQFGLTLVESFKTLALRFKIRRRTAILLVFGIVLLTFSVYLVWANYDIVFEQFTRRTAHLEVTGRDKVWMSYIDFISSNFWFGNGSHKYFTDYLQGEYHAHNSYLQILATNGIFIFLLYIWLLLSHLHPSNLIYITALAIYSMAQYGIFWGISLADIILVFFLLKGGKMFRLEALPKLKPIQPR